MMADNMAIPVAYDINKSGGMFGGGDSSMWIFFLFILLMGGNGFGGLGGGATAGAVTNDFLYSNLNAGIDKNSLQIDAVQTALGSGLSRIDYNSLSNFKDLSSQSAMETCGINRNIDNVKYEALQNTNAIIQAGNANTQAILDKMCQSEVQALRDKVLGQEMLINTQNQERALLQELRPYPTPSYIVSSPYGIGGNGTCFA